MLDLDDQNDPAGLISYGDIEVALQGLSGYNRLPYAELCLRHSQWKIWSEVIGEGDDRIANIGAEEMLRCGLR